MVVVDAGDAILVCPKERSQEAKQVVERLRADGGDTGTSRSRLGVPQARVSDRQRPTVQRKENALRVLITGITGFAGSHLAEFILENHPEVEVFGGCRWRSRMEHLRELGHQGQAQQPGGAERRHARGPGPAAAAGHGDAAPLAT